MASINFLYRSKKEQSPLILRLLYRYNGQDFVYGCKTKLIVEKEYWFKDHKIKNPKDIDLINEQHSVKTELNKIKNHVLNLKIMLYCILYSNSIMNILIN